jgi:hypothetical protein
MNSLIVSAILITLCFLPSTWQWGEGGWGPSNYYYFIFNLFK